MSIALPVEMERRASRAQRLLDGRRAVRVDRVGGSDAHLAIGLHRAARADGQVGQHVDRRRAAKRVAAQHRASAACGGRGRALRVGRVHVRRPAGARARRRHALVHAVERLGVLEALDRRRLLHHQRIRRGRAQALAPARQDADRQRARRRQTLQLQHTLALLSAQTAHTSTTIESLFSPVNNNCNYYF